MALSSTSFTVKWIYSGATSYTYTLNGTPVTPSTDNGVASQDATFTGLTAGTDYVLVITADSYASSPVLIRTNPSLVVLLKGIDYITGNNWYDKSYYGRNATLENGYPTMNSLGNALVLDGQTCWTFPNVAVGNAWTASVWYKQTGEPVGEDSANYAQILTQNYDLANPALINLTIGRQNSPNYTGGFAAQGQGTPITITNTWMNIQVTWDGTDLATYIDGVLIGTTQPGGTSQDGGLPYSIGRIWQNAPIYVVGEIGEVRIYNVPSNAATSPG
jgi:hypothetical protein